MIPEWIDLSRYEVCPLEVWGRPPTSALAYRVNSLWNYLPEVQQQIGVCLAARMFCQNALQASSPTADTASFKTTLDFVEWFLANPNAQSEKHGELLDRLVDAARHDEAAHGDMYGIIPIVSCWRPVAEVRTHPYGYYQPGLGLGNEQHSPVTPDFHDYTRSAIYRCARQTVAVAGRDSSVGQPRARIARIGGDRVSRINGCLVDWWQSFKNCLAWKTSLVDDIS